MGYHGQIVSAAVLLHRFRVTLFHLILLYTPHLEYMTDRRNHSLETPAVGDSSIRLTIQPTAPERRCRPFLVRVAR